MESIVVIDKNEYEELVRDSEKLRCIETLVMDPDVTLQRNVILGICGMTANEVK